MATHNTFKIGTTDYSALVDSMSYQSGFFEVREKVYKNLAGVDSFVVKRRKGWLTLKINPDFLNTTLYASFLSAIVSNPVTISYQNRYLGARTNVSCDVTLGAAADLFHRGTTDMVQLEAITFTEL